MYLPGTCQPAVFLQPLGAYSAPGCAFPWRYIPWRVYFNHAGDDRWYDVNVPIADHLYNEHLEELRKEGLIND